MEEEVEARIEFHNLNKKQMEHLFKAEKELSKAGVSFDTGYDMREAIRDWELDWSLEGAKVFLKLTNKEVK